RLPADLDPTFRSLPMTRSAFALFFALSLVATAVLPQGPTQAPLPLPSLEPPTTGGVAPVERPLHKLPTSKRLLAITAHPHDDATSLLARISRGRGGKAAYLALSRGEGGQNLIGPELGVGLGIIRTRELLAARGIDGGRQYFTRAFDFGYTLSLDETL